MAKKNWDYAVKGAALGAGLGAVDHAISGAMAGYAAGGKTGALKGAATSSLYGVTTGTLEGGLIGAGVDFFSKHKRKLKRLKKKLHSESIFHPKTERGKKILHTAAKGGLIGIGTGGIKGVIAGAAAGYKLGGRAALMTGAKTGGKFGAATGILSGAIVGAGIAATEKKKKKLRVETFHPFVKELGKEAAKGAAGAAGRLALYGAVGAVGLHAYKKHKAKLKAALGRGVANLEKAAHTEGYKPMKKFSELREEQDLSWLSRMDEDTLNEFTLRGYGKTAMGVVKNAYHKIPPKAKRAATGLGIGAAGGAMGAYVGKRFIDARGGDNTSQKMNSEEYMDERTRGGYAHPMELHVQHGAFHRWLGKSEDEPITASDIQKGLRAGGHAAKMAIFAKNARKWHHVGPSHHTRLHPRHMGESWYDVDKPTPLKYAHQDYERLKSMSPEQRHLHVRNVRAINALKGTAYGAALGSVVAGPIGGTVGAVAGGLSNYTYSRPRRPY